MNATVKMVAVIGLVLIAGFACGYLFAGATAPVPQAKEMIVEVIGYSNENPLVSDQNYVISVDNSSLQLGTNTTFVRENKIESWRIFLHNI